MTEPSPERLRDLMVRYGFTEKEARIYLHLDEAERLLDDLVHQDRKERSSGSQIGAIIWRDTHVHEAFSTLHRRLAMRVLKRLYPKGYGYVPPEGEEDE